MAQKQQQHYQWTNRSDYSNDGLQQIADKLVLKQTEEEENTNVRTIIDTLIAKSDFAMVQFNDQTREMSLHHLPNSRFKTHISSQSIGIKQEYNSITNFFVYQAMAERLFGARGSRLTLSASRNYKGREYGLLYRKTLWERLDNSFSTNKDQIAFVYSRPNLAVKLGRESRGNFIDLKDKNQSFDKIVGMRKEQATILKHSNLLSLHLDFKYAFLNLQSKLGWDYGNKSLFMASKLKLDTSIELSKRYKLYMSVQGAQIDGQNILKNDLLFRNKKNWPGNRTYNFITPRVELIFAQYPYLSFLNLKPYFYGQLWANFHHKAEDNNRLSTKIQLDYGIGLTSNDVHKLDISLFKMSTQKTGRFPFGQIKFTF